MEQLLYGTPISLLWPRIWTVGPWNHTVPQLNYMTCMHRFVLAQGRVHGVPQSTVAVSKPGLQHHMVPKGTVHAAHPYGHGDTLNGVTVPLVPMRAGQELQYFCVRPKGAAAFLLHLSVLQLGCACINAAMGGVEKNIYHRKG